MHNKTAPERNHLSFSQLNLFSNCAEAYRRRYILGEIIPPGVAALKGGGVHGGVAVNHRQKVKTGRDLPVTDIVGAAVAAFEEKRAKDGVQLSADEMKVGLKPTLARAKDSTAELARLYAEQSAPSIQPTLVEETIRVEVAGAEHDLLAVIDVATQGNRVLDFKTAARAKAQRDADESLQLTWYAIAYKALTGAPPAGLGLEVLVDTGKILKHQSLRTTRTLRDFEVLVARINAFLLSLKAGNFPPANVGHWMCGNGGKWCAYWHTCAYVNNERKACDAASD
jgi:hypothetical protein